MSNIATRDTSFTLYPKDQVTIRSLVLMMRLTATGIFLGGPFFLINFMVNSPRIRGAEAPVFLTFLLFTMLSITLAIMTFSAASAFARLADSPTRAPALLGDAFRGIRRIYFFQALLFGISVGIILLAILAWAFRAALL